MPRKKSSDRPLIVKHVSPLASLVGFVLWFVGILVSLAVGFGMAYGTLTIPWLSEVLGGVIVMTAGWFVVILTILGFVLQVVDIVSQ